MSNYPLNDVFTLYDAGKLKDQNEEQLRRIHNICLNCQTGDVFTRNKTEHIAHAVLGELARIQNDRLVEQVGKLTKVADDQKQIAQESGKQAEQLLNQTNKLVGLTWALFIASIALLLFSAVQTSIMFKENAAANAQQIQKSQNQKPETPKQ